MSDNNDSNLLPNVDMNDPDGAFKVGARRLEHGVESQMTF